MFQLLHKKYRPFFKYVVLGAVIYFMLITVLIHFERADQKSGIDDYFTAVWYSLVTFTTVGYGDYVPLTKEGKLIGFLFVIGAATFFGLFVAMLSNIMNELAENKKLWNPTLRDTCCSAGVKYEASQHEIGARLFAPYILEPNVEAYAEDIMSYAEDQNDFDIKEYKVIASNPYVGIKYRDVFFHIKKHYNCILFELSKFITENGTQKLLKNPSDKALIGLGHYIIIITNLLASKRIEKFFAVEEGTN